MGILIVSIYIASLVALVLTGQLANHYFVRKEGFAAPRTIIWAICWSYIITIVVVSLWSIATNEPPV